MSTSPAPVPSESSAPEAVPPAHAEPSSTPVEVPEPSEYSQAAIDAISAGYAELFEPKQEPSTEPDYMEVSDADAALAPEILEDFAALAASVQAPIAPAERHLDADALTAHNADAPMDTSHVTPSAEEQSPEPDRASDHEPPHVSSLARSAPAPDKSTLDDGAPEAAPPDKSASLSASTHPASATIASLDAAAIDAVLATNTASPVAPPPVAEPTADLATRLADNDALIAEVTAERPEAFRSRASVTVREPVRDTPSPEPAAHTESAWLDPTPFGTPVESDAEEPVEERLPRLIEWADHDTVERFKTIGMELAEEHFKKWGWEAPPEPEIRYEYMHQILGGDLDSHLPPGMAYNDDGKPVIIIDPAHLFSKYESADGEMPPEPSGAEREAINARLVTHEIAHAWAQHQPDIQKSDEEWFQVATRLRQARRQVEMEVAQFPSNQMKWTDEQFQTFQGARKLERIEWLLRNGPLHFRNQVHEGVAEGVPASTSAKALNVEWGTWVDGSVHYLQPATMVNAIASTWQPMGPAAVQRMMTARPSGMDSFLVETADLNVLLDNARRVWPAISHDLKVDSSLGTHLNHWASRLYPGFSAKLARAQLSRAIESHRRR